jgi:rhodanese-related sulfurtransferase
MNQASNAGVIASSEYQRMCSDELAYKLIHDEPVQIFDLRSKEKYDVLALPKSYNITPDYLFGKDAYKQLSLKNVKNVFVADNEMDEIKAAFIAQKIGYDDIYVLTGGLSEFKDTILNFKMPDRQLTRREADTYRFRLEANKLLPVMIENARKQPGTETKKTKRVLGGC